MIKPTGQTQCGGIVTECSGGAGEQKGQSKDMDEDEQADTPDIKMLVIFSPSSPGQQSSASWPHVSQSPEWRTKPDGRGSVSEPSLVTGETEQRCFMDQRPRGGGC